ncbi:Oligoribonuclease [Arthrobotrys entomopaga]|nr:Oligoribonuclease [Arthrobotrys entomopaga]
MLQAILRRATHQSCRLRPLTAISRPYPAFHSRLPLVRQVSTSFARMSAENDSLPPEVVQATISGVQVSVQQPVVEPETESKRPLQSDNPLVWIDCEMSGLNPPHDKLLQIACFITDAQLNLLDTEGFETVIARPKSLLDEMDQWCIDTHTRNGLTNRVLESEVTVEQAGEALLEYIKKYVPQPRTAIMCGNSIHFDKLFISIEMPQVVEYLYYRIGDVSSIKEFAKRWCSIKMLEELPVKKYTHEAKQDILESIEEARYYRKVLFQKEDHEGQ